MACGLCRVPGLAFSMLHFGFSLCVSHQGEEPFGGQQQRLRRGVHLRNGSYDGRPLGGSLLADERKSRSGHPCVEGVPRGPRPLRRGPLAPGPLSGLPCPWVLVTCANPALAPMGSASGPAAQAALLLCLGPSGLPHHHRWDMMASRVLWGPRPGPVSF